VVKLGEFAEVKRVALTHHDPLRDDDAIDRLLQDVRAGLREAGSSLDIFAASEGQILEVPSCRLKGSQRRTGEFRAETPVEPALAERSILLALSDTRMSAALSADIRAEGIRARCISDLDEVPRLIADDRPSMAILEHNPPGIEGIEVCRAIRQQEGDVEDKLPVVVVAPDEDQALGAAAGVSDWLIKPFTSAYARTKIRAWVLRTACHWKRAAVPEDEQRRLRSLRALHLLDTEPEDRFDRITRLASALFNVPIALVSLVDENRQWFKSCHGLDAKQTSRDAAFCAHVVYDREPMIVQDTLADARFADNPLVTNKPRIRFYAGCPLILEDGACVGSLCVIDTRPRALSESDLACLRDLADLAVQEICGKNLVAGITAR
jgi:CheY-like chemotaxis protein